MTDFASLRGRAAIVTGAGSGIGAATAISLAQRGASVVLAHHPQYEHDISAVLAHIEASGGAAVACPTDVADAAHVQQLVDTCARRYKAADIIVANAGVTQRQQTVDATIGSIQRMLAVDLFGVHELFRRCVEHMGAQRYGRLLATSSTSGYLYGWAEHAGYCAAKAGVVGLVRSYAAEYACSGITANTVAPGVIRSRQSEDPVHSLGEEGLASVARRVPLGRVGEPADVAGLFTFLASDEASYINGQTIVVDGGLSIVEPD